MVAPVKRPWQVSNIDKRVYVLNADGHIMTEIEPGQIAGKPVTFEERMAIAEYIKASVNRIWT